MVLAPHRPRVWRFPGLVNRSARVRAGFTKLANRHFPISGKPENGQISKSHFAKGKRQILFFNLDSARVFNWF